MTLLNRAASKATELSWVWSFLLLLFHEVGEFGLFWVLELVAIWMDGRVRIEKVGFWVGERRRLLA